MVKGLFLVEKLAANNLAELRDEKGGYQQAPVADNERGSHGLQAEEFEQEGEKEFQNPFQRLGADGLLCVHGIEPATNLS